MWEHYRKTLIANQIFIVLVCIGLKFALHANALSILAAFLAMQVALVLGAAWSARLRGKILAHRSTLPIKNREL